jgi:hypothetical protein
MAKRLAVAATVLACLLAPAALNAVMIATTIEASASRVPDVTLTVPPFDVAVGDEFVLSFEGDSEQPDLAPSPTAGEWRDFDGTVQLGGGVHHLAESIVRVVDNGFFGDYYTVVARVDLVGQPDWLFPFTFEASTAEALAGVSIPTNVVLSDFDSTRSTVLLEGDSGHPLGTEWNFWFDGTVTAISSTVPEPAAGVLLLVGLLGLGVAGRRRSPLDAHHR